MSIKKRLIAIGGIVIFLMLSISVWAGINLVVGDRALQIYRNQTSVAQTAFELRETFNKTVEIYHSAIVQTMMGAGDEIKMSDFETNWADLQNASHAIKDVKSEHSKIILDSIERLNVPFKDGVEAIKRKDSYGASQIYSGRIQPEIYTAKTGIAELVKDTNQESSKVISESYSTTPLFIGVSLHVFAIITCSKSSSWLRTAFFISGWLCPRLLHHHELIPSMSFPPSFVNI